MTIRYDVTYYSILRPLFQHHGTLETRKSTGRCANIAGHGSYYGKFWINDWVSSRIHKTERKNKKRPCLNKKSIRSSILKISILMDKFLTNNHTSKLKQYHDCCCWASYEVEVYLTKSLLNAFCMFKDKV